MESMYSETKEKYASCELHEFFAGDARNCERALVQVLLKHTNDHIDWP